MVSELSGITLWDFVDVFPFEDMCKHHLAGHKKMGSFKKACFFCKKNLFFPEISPKPGFHFWTYNFQDSRSASHCDAIFGIYKEDSN